jgi:hypothetical protein
MPSYRRPDCLRCAHFRANKDSANTCDAFPGGIPTEILLSRAQHDRVREDQVGEFVFTVRPEGWVQAVEVGPE